MGHELISSSDAAAIRARIAVIGTTHHALASRLGMSPARLSLTLRGRRPQSSGFVASATAALDRLAEAEAAAGEARDRVLSRGAA